MLRKLLLACGMSFMAVSLMAVKCGEEPQKTVGATNFCLTGSDLSGWTPWANECRTLLPSDLEGVDDNTGGIDGGASYYYGKGMQEYTYQQLTNSDKSLKTYVMDCQNSANATTLYDSKKSEASNQLAIAGYDANTAIVAVFAGGAIYEVYVRSDKFFIMMTLSGLADDNEAKGLAEFVIGIYEGKK